MQLSHCIRQTKSPRKVYIYYRLTTIPPLGYYSQGLGRALNVNGENLDDRLKEIITTFNSKIVKQAYIGLNGSTSISFDFITTYYPHAFFLIIGETNNGYRTGTLLLNNISATGGNLGGCTFSCERKADYESTIHVTADESSKWSEFIVLYN